MKTIKQLREDIEKIKCRSAWSKGVKEYAFELLDNAEDNNGEDFKLMSEKELLNGADSWHQFSWGGCSLIYDGDIAKRLCNTSELKQTKNGERQPNKSEQWLDTQARALAQAARLILTLARED